MTTKRSRVARRLGACLLVVAALVATSASPAGARGRPGGSSATVVLDGLSSPKGLASVGGLIPVVGQGAFGPPGPVVLALGRHAVPVSGPMSFVDVAIATDGAIWGLESGTGQLYRKTLFGSFRHVADIPAYQATDPDPHNVADDPTESNPYGLAAFPGGAVLVADAAGNDVLKVTKQGRISTVARFTPQDVSTDHLPPEIPAPPTINAEAVPTSIAVTHNAIYVGELKGFPFRPGSSHVYKLSLDANGATCSADAPNARCRVAHGGLTSIQDIAVDQWTGKLYVYELAAEGALVFEGGFETGEFPPAVLLEIKGSQRRELAAGQLSEPGGVTASFGQVHVTDGTFTGGRLLKIRT